jgi:hypothetical protein
MRDALRLRRFVISPIQKINQPLSCLGINHIPVHHAVSPFFPFVLIDERAERTGPRCCEERLINMENFVLRWGTCEQTERWRGEEAGEVLALRHGSLMTIRPCDKPDEFWWHLFDDCLFLLIVEIALP